MCLKLMALLLKSLTKVKNAIVLDLLSFYIIIVTGLARIKLSYKQLNI